MPFDQLKGRDFIGLLGGATAAWPLRAGARATESSVGTVESVRSLVTPFAQALNGLGYVEGKNIVNERRCALGQLDRLAYRTESGPGNGFGQ